MGLVIINPGTGAVNGAEEKYAIENIKQFIIDCHVEGLVYTRVPSLDYGEGRFAFYIQKSNVSYEIQMPGLPLDKVRYMDIEDQNIWDFPRLYVDGSSWIWEFALRGEDDFKINKEK